MHICICIKSHRYYTLTLTQLVFLNNKHLLTPNRAHYYYMQTYKFFIDTHTNNAGVGFFIQQLQQFLNKSTIFSN